MRVSTALVSALVAGSSFSLAWQYSLSNQDQLPQLTASEPEGASSSPGTQSGSQNATTSTESQTPSSTATNSSAGPTPTTTSTPTKPAAPKVIELTSDPVSYKYGVVQIKITKTDGQITDVALLQGDAPNGRDVAYATLIDATLKVQGTNYGNISGATFTTDAFKKAVDNALAKG